MHQPWGDFKKKKQQKTAAVADGVGTEYSNNENCELLSLFNLFYPPPPPVAGYHSDPSDGLRCNQ